MSDIRRMSADKTREALVAGTAILVCAYGDDAKFEKFKLEGAIPLSDFKTQLKNYPKDKQIIFYCA